MLSSLVSDSPGSGLALVFFHSAEAEVGQQQHKATECLITFTTQRTHTHMLTHTHTYTHTHTHTHTHTLSHTHTHTHTHTKHTHTHTHECINERCHCVHLPQSFIQHHLVAVRGNYTHTHTQTHKHTYCVTAQMEAQRVQNFIPKSNS